MVERLRCVACLPESPSGIGSVQRLSCFLRTAGGDDFECAMAPTPAATNCLYLPTVHGPRQHERQHRARWHRVSVVARHGRVPSQFICWSSWDTQATVASMGSSLGPSRYDRIAAPRSPCRQSTSARRGIGLTVAFGGFRGGGDAALAMHYCFPNGKYKSMRTRTRGCLRRAVLYEPLHEVSGGWSS